LKKSKSSYNLVSIIGYGTFITRGIWKNKKNVEVCIIKDYIRIFPEGNSFPFVLPSEGSSFYALKFDVTQDELKNLDFYEGVSENYFKRETILAYNKNKELFKAYLYVPTKIMIKNYNLSIEMDENDKWKEEIKKFPEILKVFPELGT